MDAGHGGPNNGGHGGGGSSIGIGNYKGVMLCNRPFGGLAAAAKLPEASSNGGKGPFRCGSIADEVGIQVTKDPKSIRRPKKETALTRHRKWLAELQKTKDLLETKYLEGQEAREGKKKKFEEHESKMRKHIRKMRREAHPAAGAEGACGEGKEADEDRGPETDSPPVSKPASASSSAPGRCRRMGPKWALTSEAALAAEEQEGEEEADDLLAFARGLDFDKYIGDVEIKTMMEQVARRIQELESGEAVSLAREREKGHGQGGPRLKLRITSAPLPSNQSDGYESSACSDEEEGEEEEEDEVLALAKGVLRHKRMQRIHSARSAAAVVSKSLEKDLTDSASAEAKLCPPKIVRIDEDEGARIHGKKTPSQLPYLNRNPAV